MTIYSQTTGAGPDLVLVHGWGLHGGIWDGFVSSLEEDFRVTCVDLPGHGRSDWAGETTLDAMVEALVDAVPGPAAWLGWSLGGLLASRLALLRPDRVSALLMLASTPCFVRKPGWQSAMLPALLDSFAAELQADYQRTLNRFLSMQVRGGADASRTLKALHERMLAHGEPIPAALYAGLEILRTTDLRDQVSGITCPTLFLMGERDTLVPLNAGREALHLYPGARLEVVKDASHAPFVAEPKVIADLVRAFLLSRVSPTMKKVETL